MIGYTSPTTSIWQLWSVLFVDMALELKYIFTVVKTLLHVSNNTIIINDYTI